jgi:hypothetical protein
MRTDLIVKAGLIDCTGQHELLVIYRRIGDIDENELVEIDVDY